MKIVTRDELRKYPIGTVFSEYVPDMVDEKLRIITDSINFKDGIGWCSEMRLAPTWCGQEDNDGMSRYTNLATVDTCYYDYDKETKFAVYSKGEVQMMINALTWALTGCEGYFDMDVWIKENDSYREF